MSTRKTILVHGGLAAGVLLVVGYLFAQLAGVWVGSHTPPRLTDGVPAAADSSAGDLTAVLAWRLPVTMAAFGFLLVAAAEGLKSIWKRKPVPEAAPKPTPEAEVQRLLRELEAKQQPA